MSYHRFSNLREILQGDLTAKLLKGIESRDFMPEPCNCKKESLCRYLGKCRESIVVYQATCLSTGKAYIGNTQQHVKTRMQQHTADTKKLFTSEKKSDSFAEHFAAQIPKDTKTPDISKHINFKVEILWKGNPLSCVKTFGTRGCRLCEKERLEILRLVKQQPTKAINKNSEIYGACRHKPKFHKFCRLTSQPPASTDESDRDERVARPDSTTSATSATTTSSFESTIFRRERVRDKVKKIESEYTTYHSTKTCLALARFRISANRDDPTQDTNFVSEFDDDENEDLAPAEYLVEEKDQCGLEV
jgi:hypothetical protein